MSAPASATPSLSRSRARLLTLAALVLGLLLVEGAARLVWALLPKTWGLATPPQIMRLDDQLGWRPAPGASAASKRTGYPVEYRINDLGLRDNATTLAKPPGVRRAVLLGDSRTFGFGVPIEKHYSTLLEGYLPGLECINLGVDGFGVDQELLFLRQEGFLYQPDLVLALVSHFGDERHLHDMRWNMGKPRFLLDKGTLTLVNQPVSNTDPWYALARRLDRHASRSRAYGMVRDALLHILTMRKPPQRTDPGDALPAGAAVPGAANATAASGSAAPPLSDGPDGPDAPDAHTRELYGVALAILQAMHQESAARNATFVLATQMPELHALAQAAGLRSLDVSRSMRNPAFALPDGLAHFNEAGNGVMAWEIAQYLAREGLAP